MKTIGIECPACHAPADEKCRDVGVGDEKRNASGFHVSRAGRARYTTTAERRERAAGDQKLAEARKTFAQRREEVDAKAKVDEGEDLRDALTPFDLDETIAPLKKIAEAAARTELPVDRDKETALRVDAEERERRELQDRRGFLRGERRRISRQTLEGKVNVGDQIGNLVIVEVCDLCDTVLVWNKEGGGTLSFTMHTPAYCHDVTLGRIRMLMRMMRHEVIERARLEREKHDVLVALSASRDLIEELCGIAGVKLCAACGDPVHETEADDDAGRCTGCRVSGAPVVEQ